MVSSQETVQCLARVTGESQRAERLSGSGGGDGQQGSGKESSHSMETLYHNHSTTLLVVAIHTYVVSYLHAVVLFS